MKYLLILLLLVFNACKEEEKTTIFIETYHKDSLHSREGHSYFDGIEISKGKYIFKRPDYGHEDSVIIIIGNDYKNPPVIRRGKTFNNAVFESAPAETIYVRPNTPMKGLMGNGKDKTIYIMDTTGMDFSGSGLIK